MHTHSCAKPCVRTYVIGLWPLKNNNSDSLILYAWNKNFITIPRPSIVWLSTLLLTHSTVGTRRCVGGFGLEAGTRAVRVEASQSLLSKPRTHAVGLEAWTHDTPFMGNPQALPWFACLSLCLLLLDPRGQDQEPCGTLTFPAYLFHGTSTCFSPSPEVHGR